MINPSELKIINILEQKIEPYKKGLSLYNF
ncbi:MAG: hypothetical protein ACJA1D_001763 [Polaribacter sp.]|jgi:hypothetical protein